MDPATIAASAVALLAPYLKNIAEDFVGEAGKYVQGRAKVLWEQLRAKLEGNSQAKEALDRFEKDPESHRDELQATLENQVARDPQLSQQISAELTDIKRKAPYIRIVQKMTEAENVVGIKAKNVRAGTIDLSQAAEKAKNITGGEFDDIG